MKETLRVAVVGAAGQMGQTIIALTNSESVEIISKLDQGDQIASAGADVLIDFSQPDSGGCLRGGIESEYAAGDRDNWSLSRATESDRIGIEENTHRVRIELQRRRERAFLADGTSGTSSWPRVRSGNCGDAPPLEKRRAERNG